MEEEGKKRKSGKKIEENNFYILLEEGIGRISVLFFRGKKFFCRLLPNADNIQKERMNEKKKAGEIAFTGLSLAWTLLRCCFVPFLALFYNLKPIKTPPSLSKRGGKEEEK